MQAQLMYICTNTHAQRENLIGYVCIYSYIIIQNNNNTNKNNNNDVQVQREPSV